MGYNGAKLQNNYEIANSNHVFLMLIKWSCEIFQAFRRHRMRIPSEDAFLITILYEKSCIYLDISFGFIKFVLKPLLFSPAISTSYSDALCCLVGEV